ncbi:NR4A2 [Lepeophtheirus salmonis]|uniref:NR4A2 n=1 Tax=Lepeophtheirus salmonis TaxID=72036 RepID=A0A7R8D0R7_LEPSM|nr:NR4A2 [Lepeophtheirus salmonis]CAF2961234.1 NR4A2 [Lepeophtheirus salmonis]
MELDISAFSCLCGLILVNERHGLSDPKKVESIENKIINSLKDHVTYNPEAQKKEHYMTRILDRLPALRSLSMQGLQRIFFPQMGGSRSCSTSHRKNVCFQHTLLKGYNLLKKLGTNI